MERGVILKSIEIRKLGLEDLERFLYIREIINWNRKRKFLIQY
jgi:hypothetical protein